MGQLFLILILLSSHISYATSECTDVFRFAGVFTDGRNPAVGSRMRSLQSNMNEVEVFLKALRANSGQRSKEALEKALSHTQELVRVTEDLIANADQTLAPARLLQKPLEERDAYLRMYKGMYQAQLRIFQKILNDFLTNKNKTLENWNFKESEEAFLEIQTVMARGHLKF